MLLGWDNFYLLTGTAAAGLVGLLFVVSTLNAGRDLSSVARGVRIYLSPVVFHLAIVLTLSAVMEIPRVGAGFVAAAFGAGALAGFVMAVWIGSELRRSKTSAAAPHWTDFWFYAFAPAALYAALGAAAALLLAQAAVAADLIALALLALLLVSIRNAWDLVTWLTPRRPEGG